jgi:predicted outer membrane protein
VKIGRVSLVLTSCALAGCSSRPAGPPTSPIGSTHAPRPRPLQRAVSPATFIAQAASIDLFVVRSSELAQLRSADPRLRNVAKALAAAHEGTAAQLSFAGRRLNLLPGATLLPQHQAMLDELTASADFDRAYKRLQLAVHGAAFSLHSDYARRGDSPTLRPVAANAAAVERSHLDMLRRL